MALQIQPNFIIGGTAAGGPVHGSAGEASAPQSPQPARAGVGCCGSGRPGGKHDAGKPGIDPAEPSRLCGVVPGLEVSLGKLLEHRLVELGISE